MAVLFVVRIEGQTHQSVVAPVGYFFANIDEGFVFRHAIAAYTPYQTALFPDVHGLLVVPHDPDRPRELGGDDFVVEIGG